MPSPDRTTTHLDWADEAEAAERAEAWPQAAALWRKAIDLCDDPDRHGAYTRAAEECDRQIAIDERLAAIARRVLRIPTLVPRQADQIDFYEVAVWSVQEALRLAYRLDREPE